jgi:hypothetical protein
MSLEPFLGRTRIAYFTMEIAIRPEMRGAQASSGSQNPRRQRRRSDDFAAV